MDAVIAQRLAQSTQPTTPAAEAVRKQKSSTTGWSKLIAKPSFTISHKKKRSRHLENGHGYLRSIYLSAVDEGYMKDLKKIHEKPVAARG